MSRRAIQFHPYAPSAGLTIASGAVNGLNNAMSNYAKMRMQHQQMQMMQQMRQAQGQYFQARAAALNRQNMTADTSRVQFAHDYANYMKGQGNDDAAKSIMKAAQPVVDKVVQNMPADQANAYRAKIQQEIQNRQPLESDISSLNPNEQKLYSQQFGNDTKESVAGTQAGARVAATVQQGQNWMNRVDEQNQGKLNVAQLKSQYRSHDDAMKDVTSQMNQTAKALSPSNPYSSTLAPETKQYLQGKMDDLQGQYHQLSTMDPKQWGKQQATPVSGSNPGSQQAPAGPKVWNHDQWQQAQPGDYIVHAGGQGYQMQQGGNVVPAQVPQTAVPALVAAPSAPVAAPAAPLGG